MAAGRGPFQAFIGQPGLADPRSARYHYARLLTGAQCTLEDLKLWAAADDRPPLQRGRHASSIAALACADKRPPRRRGRVRSARSGQPARLPATAAATFGSMRT